MALKEKVIAPDTYEEVDVKTLRYLFHKIYCFISKDNDYQGDYWKGHNDACREILRIISNILE